MKDDLFSVPVTPDWAAFVSCIERKGTPDRVHYIELFLDGEIQTAICDRFDLLEELDRDDPFFEQKRQVILQRFLGYDYVTSSV